MPSRPHLRSPLLQQFLSLLVWVRERPWDYCATVGELEEFLASLYEICATSDGQAERLGQSVCEALSRRGLVSREHLLTATERGRDCAEGELSMTKLVAFWTELDQDLAFPSPGATGGWTGIRSVEPGITRPR